MNAHTKHTDCKDRVVRYAIDGGRAASVPSCQGNAAKQSNLNLLRMIAIVARVCRTGTHPDQSERGVCLARLLDQRGRKGGSREQTSSSKCPPPSIPTPLAQPTRCPTPDVQSATAMLTDEGTSGNGPGGARIAEQVHASLHWTTNPFWRSPVWEEKGRS